MLRRHDLTLECSDHGISLDAEPFGKHSAEIETWSRQPVQQAKIAPGPGLQRDQPRHRRVDAATLDVELEQRIGGTTIGREPQDLPLVFLALHRGGGVRRR